MSDANPLWGAPRIHGELLKLGVAVSQATVSKYMSQAWRTSLKNHARDLIALDFFTVPTATFRVLFVLVVLSHGRRRLRHFNITEHPTADRCRCWGASRRLHSDDSKSVWGGVCDFRIQRMGEPQRPSVHESRARRRRGSIYGLR